MLTTPVPSRLQYATIAMIELATRYSGRQVVSARDIADSNGIPVPFLTQILHQLRAAGLVASVRGNGGGYRLGRDPSQITLLDIAGVWSQPADAAIEEPSDAARCAATAWQQIHAAACDAASDVRLEQLVGQVKREEVMFHI